MEFVPVCVWFLMLAKSVYAESNCVSIPGDLYSNDTKTRHVVCDDSASSEECSYSSVEVLRLLHCSVETLESEFMEYKNVHTLDISFSRYKTLIYLHLNFEHLRRFNVSHNNLEEVQEYLFKNTQELIEVDLSHNEIEKFPELIFSNVLKLEMINISHNKINKIDGLFDKLFELKVLDLSDNEINDFPSDAFVKDSKLKVLNLKNNPIGRLDCKITQLLSGWTSINVSFENVFYLDLSCANPIEWTTNGAEIIFRNAQNQNELRCERKHFKNLQELYVHGNRLRNPLDLIKMLGESLRALGLNGNSLGLLDESAFRGLNNINRLYLNETNLKFAASNPFKDLHGLTALDISYNNLTTLNVTLFAETLKYLERFTAMANHFGNTLEIIDSLGSALKFLYLSQNFIGSLNDTTFDHLEHLMDLNLSDCHLQHFDVNPHDSLSQIDLSRNNLKRLNVTRLSKVLDGLYGFYAADNQFENTAEIIEHLGSNLMNDLDLSGSYVGKVNETTFKRFDSLMSLTLRRTNLSISDMKPFESLAKSLQRLDISNNNLLNLDFSTTKQMEFLEINLSGNQLTQLNGLTEQSYPNLKKLHITNNQLNCTYLSRFRKEWKELKIIGDFCADEAFIATTISYETVSRSYDGLVYTVVISISVPIVIIIIIAVVVFVRRKKSSSQNNRQMDVSYHTNDDRNKDQQPEPQPGRPVPRPPVQSSNPEDHIYEEIIEREQPYDHLRFQLNPTPMTVPVPMPMPMPISAANQHYHNFMLLNRNRTPQHDRRYGEISVFITMNIVCNQFLRMRRS